MGRYFLPIGTIAWLWVSFIVIILLFPSSDKPGVGDMNYAVVIIGGVFVLSALTWVLSARKWFTGPISNLDRESSRTDIDEQLETKNEKQLSEATVKSS